MRLGPSVPVGAPANKTPGSTAKFQEGLMLRTVALMTLGAVALGCGDSGITPPCQEGCPPLKPAVTSVSPNQAFALSPEIRLTITGSSFQGSTHERSRVVWCVGSDTTVLTTTFVSDSTGGGTLTQLVA